MSEASRVFGEPMPWVTTAEWGKLSVTKRRSTYLGKVGEDYLARGVNAALSPGMAAGALLGAPTRDSQLGDIDMVIHINARGTDHIMLVDSKNRKDIDVKSRDVDRAQRRMKDLVERGALGETRRGKRDGWHGVRLSYHFVFVGEGEENGRQDLRDRHAAPVRHPGGEIHDSHYPVFAETYEMLFGDVLARALSSTTSDDRGCHYDTLILDMISSECFDSQALPPFEAIMSRDSSFTFTCHEADCTVADTNKVGRLSALMHDQWHRPDAPQKSLTPRRIRDLASANRMGVPDWEALLFVDRDWGWEEGTSAGVLLGLESHDLLSPGSLDYIRPESRGVLA